MARPEKTKTKFGQRLREVRGSVKREVFARQLDITERSLGNYERGDRVPDSVFLEKIRLNSGVNLNWLLTGEGAMKQAKDKTSPEAPVSPTQDVRQIPINGLASCGPEGWSRLETMQFQAEAPKSIQWDKDAFAVIAKGESMQPMGIYEGFLCFCSPATEMRIGDIVCVERKDPDGAISLTIKKLGVIGHDAVELIGYLPLEETPSSGTRGEQFQKLFWETVYNRDIERISVVTHIYTRPSAF